MQLLAGRRSFPCVKHNGSDKCKRKMCAALICPSGFNEAHHGPAATHNTITNNKEFVVDSVLQSL